MAALEVEKAAEANFGALKWMAELRGFEVKIARPLRTMDLLHWFNGDLVQAQSFNPHIRGYVWGRGAVQPRNFIRVPLTYAATIEDELKNLKGQPVIEAATTDSEYVMQEGETIGEIAERFKVKIQALLEMNGIDDPRRVRALQKIIIPTRVGANTPPGG